jgi:hypothetical protein
MWLRFDRVSTKEYRARFVAPDGARWHHAVYTVRSTPQLQRDDPFNAWQAESPEGFLLAHQVALADAMTACHADAPTYIALAEADSSDPTLMAEAA